MESWDENPSEVEMFQGDAMLALETLGFKIDVAARVVGEALACDALQSLIKAALTS